MQSGLHNGRKTVDVVVVLLLYYSAAVLSTTAGPVSTAELLAAVIFGIDLAGGSI